MSVNKERRHVLVLPEDDANRQIANGFQSAIPFQNIRRLQILREAGGWAQVRDDFLSDQVRDLERYPKRYMVLVIDSDGRQDRLQSVRDQIPLSLRDRVFVIGVFTRPERLTPSLGSFEVIGRSLAKDCDEGTSDAWDHELLNHNHAELKKMREHLRPFLFGNSD